MLLTLKRSKIFFTLRFLLNKIYWALRWTAAIWIGIVLLLIVFLKYINPPFTPLMILRMTQSQQGYQTERIIKKWVFLQEVSPELINAIIYAEDRAFWKHNGFDWIGIKTAYRHNRKYKHRPPIGFSTISNQTAKNVFLYPAQTYTRKILEAFFTVLIELIWGKERIMEMYINIVEMGHGTYGFEAASQLYLKKSAQHLTREEAHLLVKFLPDPHFLRTSVPPKIQIILNSLH